jgi:hypothetical protein
VNVGQIGINVPIPVPLVRPTCLVEFLPSNVLRLSSRCSAGLGTKLASWEMSRSTAPPASTSTQKRRCLSLLFLLSMYTYPYLQTVTSLWRQEDATGNRATTDMPTHQ